MSTQELEPAGHYHRGDPSRPCEECGQPRGHTRHTCIHGERGPHATTRPPLGDGHCSGPGSLWPVREGTPGPGSYRVEGDMLVHLDAVAVAARNLFEALQRATSAALRQSPAPAAAECRHCGRALQLAPHPWQDPLRFTEVAWVDADGSPACRGVAAAGTDPGTYLPHEPMPTPPDRETGLPQHRCPGCQRVHPYPVEV